jgi:hypothetical protein
MDKIINIQIFKINDKIIVISDLSFIELIY